jgi:hypothetical protein
MYLCCCAVDGTVFSEETTKYAIKCMYEQICMLQTVVHCYSGEDAVGSVQNGEWFRC